MKTFKRLQFGFVPTDFNTTALSNTEQILLSYVKSCVDVTTLTDVDATAEVFALAKSYVGDNFRNWLIANYGNGSAPRASLCSAIANWVAGDVSGQAVISAIKRDLNRLNYLDHFGSQTQSDYIFSINTEDLSRNVRFEGMTQRHYYAFVSLIGPELLAHLCLSVSGIRLATV